jgi:hypothetical protein
LTISSLTCDGCKTRLEGSFTTCKFCKLPVEQQEFVEVFIKCRGSIKDVEKELGISYPTVRNRLDSVVQALGYGVERQDFGDEKARKQEIVTALQNGEITTQEAARQLRRIGK